jgi:hypothetical protein
MSPVDWPVLFVAFIFTVVAERFNIYRPRCGFKVYSDYNWFMGFVAGVCFLVAAYLYIGVVNWLIVRLHSPEFLTFMAVAFVAYLIQVTFDALLKRRAKVV